MKILVAHSDPGFKERHAIDIWRIVRPFAELEKHVDWQIDYRPHLIDQSLMNPDDTIPADALIKELQKLGEYDIVWTGYFADAVLLDALVFASQQFGFRLVVDCDDDFWSIAPSNPIYRKPSGVKDVQETRYVLENTPFLVVSTQNLKDGMDKRRTGKSYILPNYIGGYKHKPFDNGSDCVIVFFGGAAHRPEFEKTGFLPALKRLMKTYPNVRAGAVGVDFPGMTGTLKKRYTFHPGKPGQAYLDELWPNINADISVAPLLDNTFNRRKTNIKWLETALIPAAFVGSNIPPYAGTVENDVTGVLVENTEDAWYAALEKLVLDKALRLKLAHNALEAVKREWLVENKWQTLKTIIEMVYSEKPGVHNESIIELVP